MVLLLANSVSVLAVILSFSGTTLLPIESVVSSHCVKTSTVAMANKKHENSLFISSLLLLLVSEFVNNAHSVSKQLHQGLLGKYLYSNTVS